MRAAERERVLTIIDQTFLEDSVMANAQNIRLLNNFLTDTINQKFDSLLSIIDIIKKSKEKTDSLLIEYAANITQDSTTTDSIFYALLDKVLPLVQQKIHKEENVENELTTLKRIRYFYGRPRIPEDTFNILLDSVRNWRVTLKRKEGILAFYPYEMEGNYLDYNLGIVGTLIYDGYMLNGETGGFTNLGSSATRNGLEEAKAAGCNVVLTIRGGNTQNVEAFLSNKKNQQQAFINTFSDIIQRQGYDGINVDFGTALPLSYRAAFNAFIQTLSDTVRFNCSTCKLIVTIPSQITNSVYDINKLKGQNVFFVIDFSSFQPGNRAGPLASLNGGQGIRAIVSRYLNSNVAPSKFIVGLPYYGIKWKIDPANGSGQFVERLSQDEIASGYPGLSLYDPTTGSAFMNLKNDRHQLTAQIWYNNSKTFDDIYNFILQNGLGGVAVIPLKKTIGFSDLWTGIGDKFLTLHSDTLLIDYFKGIKTAEMHYMDSIKEESLLTTWQYFKKYASSSGDSLLWEIGFLFEHPCETEFPIGYQSTVLNQNLKKDTTILLKNDPSVLNQSLSSILVKYTTIPISIRMESRVRFFRIHRVVNYLSAWTSAFFLLCFLVVFIIYLSKIRRQGKEWKYRKNTGILLLILAALFILFTFIYLFMSDLVPGFGTNVNETGRACYDMPIQTLLLIILSGLVLGIVIMRYLIFSLIRRDNVP